MSDSHQPANDAGPAAALTDDPEILALLDFAPVPRAQRVRGEWTAALQRELVARIAGHGSLQQACDDMNKCRSGVNKLRKHKLGAGFSAAIDGAIALARRRLAEADALVERMEPGLPAAPIDYRRRRPLDPVPRPGGGGLPGQLLNEHGEYEDEESFNRRAEEAKESIAMKLVRCRRAFLHEISGDAGKRAAFEILTELPVDWALAARLEPQPFEPWHRSSQREADMVLTAESGWSFGEIGYGPDRKAAARAAIDAWRAERGLEPIAWEEEASARPVEPNAYQP
jgi:hypothetical protein